MRSALLAVAVPVPLLSVLCLPGMAAAAPASAVPITSYSFTSTSGDVVGQGDNGTYTTPPAAISVTGDGTSVSISVRDGADTWQIELAAPVGQSLTPGMYTDAERADFRTGRAPGLDARAGGRGCQVVYGQFSVNQIGYDNVGDVQTLDAGFEQHCESADAPALRGTVRFQALPLGYEFTSDSGDRIGQGRSESYSGATTTFDLSGTTDDIRMVVSGQRDNWSMEFAPPAGERLHAGTYGNAERAGTQTAGSPGLDVFGNAQACDTVTGSFTIDDLVADPGGRVLAFAATFVQYCDGAAAALHGSINYLAGSDIG